MTTTTHTVVIDHYADSRCNTPGHYDTLVTCSCGWSKRLSHGSGDTGVLGHRLAVLEEAAGITFDIGVKK